MPRYLAWFFLFISWNALAMHEPVKFTKRMDITRRSNGTPIYQIIYCASDPRFGESHCVSKFKSFTDSQGNSQKNYKLGDKSFAEESSKKRYFEKQLQKPLSEKGRQEFKNIKTAVYQANYDTERD